MKKILTSETDAFAHVYYLEYCYSFILPLEIPYFGVPNSGHGPVCSLLGTGLHISRWTVQEWAKLHFYLQLLPLFTLPPELHLPLYHGRYNKYNALKSSWNHPFASWSVEKLSSMKPIPGAQNVGVDWEDKCVTASVTWSLSAAGLFSQVRPALKP